ncbi:hypothetical protein BKA65DRAFT_552845 [Rhexocercosporidium sp. MPI-PUGE-AT-0058]|nr:hypothetical protein BKA65DRAFT_552845 [Rhexocercosporidium sp. MPI-PUGE-AT-0058]
MELDVFSEAMDLAKEAAVATIFIGNNAQWEMKGQDMNDMHLPADGSRDRTIAATAAVNPLTIVVNTTGLTATPRLDDVPVACKRGTLDKNAETPSSMFCAGR